MNRRSFLKLFGVVAAAPLLPEIARSAIAPEIVTHNDIWDKFNPSLKYGNSICLTDPLDELSHEAKMRIFSIIERSMRDFVPPGYWGKVEYIYRYDYYDDSPTLAWKYSP